MTGKLGKYAGYAALIGLGFIGGTRLSDNLQYASKDIPTDRRATIQYVGNGENTAPYLKVNGQKLKVHFYDNGTQVGDAAYNWQIFSDGEKKNFVKEGIRGMKLEDKFTVIGEEALAMTSPERTGLIDKIYGQCTQGDIYTTSSIGLRKLQDESLKQHLITAQISRMSEERRKEVIENAMQFCDDQTREEIASQYMPGVMDKVKRFFSFGGEHNEEN
ncbi:MAG: hypothetical protein AABX59_01100 [Nanoarchaeota archaeon]